MFKPKMHSNWSHYYGSIWGLKAKVRISALAFFGWGRAQNKLQYPIRDQGTLVSFTEMQSQYISLITAAKGAEKKYSDSPLST